VLWNKFMAIHSGTAPEELLDQPFFKIFPDIPRAWFKKKLESVFVLKTMAFTSWEQRPYLFKFPHNRPVTGGVEYMHQDLTFMPVKDERGEVTQVVVTLQDSTDLCIYKQAHEQVKNQLQTLSQIDGLTGLYNRHHWESCLVAEVERVKRYGGDLSLILFDLDYFKKVNDTHGHLAGDEVLKRISDILREQLRDCDFAGRYGGEEFGIILPSTKLSDAEILAERLRVEVQTTLIYFDDRCFSVSISLGLVGFRPSAHNHEYLLHCADEALYASKKRGRNCCTPYVGR